MSNNDGFHFIEGERLYLREVRLSDINENYYRWMNDPEVTKFLEIKYTPHSMDDIRRYVERLDGRTDEIFFAICLKESNEHIGNIKLGPINWIHRFGDISLVIGQKDCWNKGFAREAIRLVSEYAFSILNLHKITAGFHESNIGSIKAFEKAGFVAEGRRIQQYFFNGEYADIILMGKVNTKKCV